MSINRIFIGMVCEKAKFEIKNNRVIVKAFFIFVDAK
jgi:hypothetical protein